MNNSSNTLKCSYPLSKMHKALAEHGGGQPPGSSRFVCAGGFTPDMVAPTCGGLGAVVEESQALMKDEFLRSAKDVMNAVWTQALPSSETSNPIVNSIADLIVALNNGWAYNVNEGDCLYYVFGDIRPIDRNGQMVGVGTQAPDGAFIHDGRELVCWRERRWAKLRGPEHQKNIAAKHMLRVI
jgi:hypothetical protein